MRPTARMRLESVSKLWTAVLLLRLEQEHKLSLDDSVERWLAGVLPEGDGNHIRQLLNHTSGLIDTNDLRQHPSRYLAQVKDPALRARLIAASKRLTKNPAYEVSPQLWVQWAGALPLLLPPGTAYHYSNIGYIVAGRIAEEAGRERLARLFRNEIIAPLRLESAAYDPRARITGPHAHGYRVATNGGLTDTTRWTWGLGANGGVVADAATEARFLTALMEGGLLRPTQLKALRTPSGLSSYGLGTSIEQSGCAGTVYGHNGGGDGFESNVYVSGDGKRVTVLLLNGRTADGHGDARAYETMRKLYCLA